jgi:hypothetical protein
MLCGETAEQDERGMMHLRKFPSFPLPSCAGAHLLGDPPNQLRDGHAVVLQVG